MKNRISSFDLRTKVVNQVAKSYELKERIRQIEVKLFLTNPSYVNMTDKQRKEIIYQSFINEIKEDEK